MKKMLASVLVVVAIAAIAASVKAVNLEGNPPPFVSVYGGGMNANSAVVLGKNARDLSTIAFMGTACVNITAGDLVVLAGTTYAVSISKTATAGDPAVVGVALTTATTGNAVQVAIAGVVRVNSSVNSVYGAKYIAGGTAGKVTAVAAVAETLFTPLSATALVVRALETRTIGADPSFLALIISK